MTQGGVRDGRAVAADPEVHLQIEQVIMTMDPSDPHYASLLGSMIIYMAVLRFAHVQRSMLTKRCAFTLHGVCTRGKGRPGFRWLMPRFGPLGCDIGGRAWQQWYEASKIGVQQFLIADEQSGSVLKLDEFHKALRSSLAKHVKMSNPEL